MSALLNFRGDDKLRHGGSMYSTLMDSSLFLSLSSGADLYCSPRKRSRIEPTFVFGRGEFAAMESEKPPCSIESLPDECFFEIFTRLAGPKERSISACVSRRWLSLLSTIRASEFSKKIGGDDSAKLVKKPLPDLNETEAVEEEEEEPAVDIDGGFLTRRLVANEATDIRLTALAIGTAGHGGLGKLMIIGSNRTRGVTDLGISAVARHCPSLRVLSLWNVPRITNAGLVEIAEGCPLLEKLDLYNCPLISDKCLLAIAQKCPNLQSLAIGSCSGIKNEGLQAVGRHCSKLHSVSIRDCPQVGDLGVASMVSSASTSLAKINIQNLNITDASVAVIGYYGKAVTDLTLTGLQNVGEKGFWVMGNALGLQKLKAIFITSCRGLTDIGLQAIAKGCPSLKQLFLSKCCSLSDAGLKAFAEAARMLEGLSLEECNRITVTGVLGGLINCYSKLKMLSLVKCTGIRDITFLPTELPICMSLRSLTIRECPGFTSRSLAFVGKICPKLQQINLSGLVGVTDAGLLPLIESSESCLVKVCLDGCISLTDAVIYALVKDHGETLKLLHLNGCNNVTDKSLLAISGFCSKLVDLELSGSKISDYGVAALASARQLELRVLSLTGCSILTEKCLPFLGNMGKSLVGLNLQRCNLITRNGIDLLEGKLWWCDIIS